MEEIYTLVRVIVIFPSQKYITIHRGQVLHYRLPGEIDGFLKRS